MSCAHRHAVASRCPFARSSGRRMRPSSRGDVAENIKPYFSSRRLWGEGSRNHMVLSIGRQLSRPLSGKSCPTAALRNGSGRESRDQGGAGALPSAHGLCRPIAAVRPGQFGHLRLCVKVEGRWNSGGRGGCGASRSRCSGGTECRDGSGNGYWPAGAQSSHDGRSARGGEE